ncbi:pentatricopeptide repeat-containing protein At2g33680-like isoform X2 [Selaginella moellendorffii]|uniref:pentatricopeptide repeat-containing protein At2g33680-like isoform X2 n=1 Tax=Selaginella moellendorffii TaxID=88036 RepID=UPI000D1CABAB|nr:pentatricopeptide repeat-containing protein At2g33680-like isoform X2 [Selaginella moellendorffii]|eukprot:XP_024529322.1 pentatricopeptide repeat-containing protein At2g33680-like isoform X2 [Selaginella moellendorffii]
MDLLGSRNSFAELLRHCKSLREAKSAHADVAKAGLDRSDTFLGNLVVQMYARCGSLQEARKAFDRIKEPNVFSWTLLITAYARNGQIEEASFLYDSAPEPDVILSTAMLTALVENNKLDEARKVFSKMPEKNVVSWNAMISGFVQAGLCEEAFGAFQQMDLDGFSPNSVTLVSILSGCTSLAQGKMIHGSICFEVETKAINALISMYGRFASLVDARSVFDALEEKDIVSWTGMISAYVHNQEKNRAMETFARMDLEGVSPNRVTLVSVLNCCSAPSSVTFIRAEAVAAGFQAHISLNNALITAYARTGLIKVSRAIFLVMPEKDTISFNAMIIAYAQQGHAREALELPWLMEMEGFSRDRITFTNIFFACGHSGLLERCWEDLLAMQADFQLKPLPDHYQCLMELLGKAGKLEEVEDLIGSMPYEPDSVAWNSLLGACKIHSDSSRGTRATQRYVDLSPGPGFSIAIEVTHEIFKFPGIRLLQEILS